ncbi:MAG: diguanylate cyclase, partial [Aquincola sp.]|nr:diguanylate cyclase [Aquincola sp.]
KVVEGSMSASRIGGDEFALLLPGVDERGGQRIMEQLRDLLALNNQFHASAPLHLSLGAATGQHGARLEAVIHEADQAMYESKRSFYAKRERDRRSGFSSLD